jgi:hypothetical protein
MRRAFFARARAMLVHDARKNFLAEIALARRMHIRKIQKTSMK